MRPILLRFSPIIASIIAIYVFFSPFLVSSARASLTICNKTEERIAIALGYRNNAGWVSEGWWHIDDTNCLELIEGDLIAQFYYLYAVGFTSSRSWGGQRSLCIAPDSFTINGFKDCATRGFDQRGFAEIDTGDNLDWIVDLTKPDNHGATTQNQ